MREVPREKMAMRLVTWGLIPRGVHRGTEKLLPVQIFGSPLL